MRIACLFSEDRPLFGEHPDAIVTLGYLRALADLGHRVTVFCPDAGEIPAGADGWLEDVVVVPLRRLPRLRARSGRRGPEKGSPLRVAEELLYNAPLVAALGARHRERRFDALLERNALWRFGVARAAARLGIPRLLLVDTPLADEERRYRAMALPALGAWLERRAWRSADAVFAASADLRRRLLEAGVAPDRLELLPNGVCERLFAAPPARAAARRVWGLSGGFVVGFISTFRPWHGADLLAPLADRLAASSGDWTLFLVGDGPLRAGVLAELRRRGHGPHVVAPGTIPHARIPEALSAMDAALVLGGEPSAAYFSPLKLFECLAAGVPVVAGAWGQIPDIVRYGVHGLLAPPGDADAFALELGRLRRDPELRAALGEAGRRLVLEKHTWRRNAERIAACAGGRLTSL